MLYVLLVMFYLFIFLIRYRISKLPRPITAKLCHMISICAD